jgi:L1 cell adhesion molecule like protein
MPRGVPQIEITYDLDANGILNVTAVEKSSGKTNNCTIKSDKSRSAEEIERMVEEAARYEAEDKAVLERVEARNGAEAYLYNVRNSINDEKLRDKISADDKESLEATVKSGLEWLDDNRDAGVAAVKEKQKEWEATVNPVMMRFAAAASGEETAAPKAPRVEEVD